MIYQKLEAHIFQVERKFQQSRKEFPENEAKQAFYEDIYGLFQVIKSEVTPDLGERDLYISKTFLDVIFQNIEHIHYTSEDEDYSKELIYCLELTLSEWVDKGYFVSISYNDSPDQFFEKSPVSADEKKLTLARQVILDQKEYKNYMVQISKPKVLYNDFLASVPVYHELGHFVEKQYEIIDHLFRDEDFRITLKINADNEPILKKHYREYFCDLFAAKYIGNSCIGYLKYTHHKKDTSPEYPTNVQREDVVNAFMKSTGLPNAMYTVAKITETVFNVTNRKLEYEAPVIKDENNPFLKCEATLVEDQSQLHSLYSYGWACWLDRNHSIHKKYQDAYVCYAEINKLIKESIRLYISRK